MAKPSPAPMLVMLAVQPAGGLTEIGGVARKSSPGTQANQNVPMPESLELAFDSVIVSLKSAPAAVELMTPLALIVAMRARPSRPSSPTNRSARDRRSFRPPPCASPPRACRTRPTKQDRDMRLSSPVAEPRGGERGTSVSPPAPVGLVGVAPGPSRSPAQNRGGTLHRDPSGPPTTATEGHRAHARPSKSRAARPARETSRPTRNDRGAYV